MFLQRHRYRYWYTGTGTPALVLVLVHWHCYWHWYTGTGTGTDDFVVLEKILGWVLRLLGTLEVLGEPFDCTEITKTPKLIMVYYPAESPRLRKEISAERPWLPISGRPRYWAGRWVVLVEAQGSSASSRQPPPTHTPHTPAGPTLEIQR